MTDMPSAKFSQKTPYKYAISFFMPYHVEDYIFSSAYDDAKNHAFVQEIAKAMNKVKSVNNEQSEEC